MSTDPYRIAGPSRRRAAAVRTAPYARSAIRLTDSGDPDEVDAWLAREDENREYQERRDLHPTRHAPRRCAAIDVELPRQGRQHGVMMRRDADRVGVVPWQNAFATQLLHLGPKGGDLVGTALRRIA